jgi:hypothetical protein
MREGEVGTEIAPIIDASASDHELAERVDQILRRTCSLARALTGAEQAALKLWIDEEPSQARKYFSLSAKYAAWHDYRPHPAGLGLHALGDPARRGDQADTGRGRGASRVARIRRGGREASADARLARHRSVR